MHHEQLVIALAKTSSIYNLPSRFNTPTPSLDDVFGDNQAALDAVRTINTDTGEGSITFVTGGTSNGKTALLEVLIEYISSNIEESDRDIVRYCDQSDSPYFNFNPLKQDAVFFTQRYVVDPPISTSSIIVIDEIRDDQSLQAAIDFAKNGYRVYAAIFAYHVEAVMIQIAGLLNINPKTYDLAIADFISIKKIALNRDRVNRDLDTFNSKGEKFEPK